MVITSSSPNVNDSNSIEPTEPVDEPPIRPFKGPEKTTVSEEVASYHKTGGEQLSREDACRYAHTVGVPHLAEQLGVDLR